MNQLVQVGIKPEPQLDHLYRTRPWGGAVAQPVSAVIWSLAGGLAVVTLCVWAVFWLIDAAFPG